MATEFTVALEERLGVIADLSEALAKSGVNITAIHAAPVAGQGVIQFVTSNADATMLALKDAGFAFVTHEVLLASLIDEPGALARLARALADAGININALYITMGQQFVLDVSDLRKAQQVALSVGVG